MHRRLHHSLTALFASAAVLALALLAGTTATTGAQVPRTASHDGHPEAVAGARHRRGHALRLPFFSFVVRN